MFSTTNLSMPVCLSFAIFCLTRLTLAASGNNAYFNGTSIVLTPTDLDFTKEIFLEFSFRTCSGGELFSQSGSDGSHFALSVNKSLGSLYISWETVSPQIKSATSIPGNFNSNTKWVQVSLRTRATWLFLTVDGNETTLASMTENSELLSLNLSDGTSLTVGDRFVGCIYDIFGIGLANASSDSNVLWNQCPLESSNCDLADPCSSSPCKNYGICSIAGTNFMCNCTARYSGPMCEVDDGSLCDRAEFARDCSQRGSCQDHYSGKYTFCACTLEYEGPSCEYNATYCANVTCQNYGTCFQNASNDGYECMCVEGFSGLNCEINVNECQTNLCRNGGLCNDGVNSYTCDCSTTGYKEDDCTIQIDECTRDPPCKNGTCIDSPGSYACKCYDGFDGMNCEMELDECLSAPCQNGGTCVDLFNSYECNCVSGYTGDNCEEDINECVNTPCQNGGNCIDGVDSFMCACINGYTGIRCQDDVDYCVQGNFSTPRCLNGATCKDNVGGFDYSCECIPGYEGAKCEIDINECASAPCINNGTCVDGVNQFMCNCTNGFDGIFCEVVVGDCFSSPCKNGGGCTPVGSSYTCNCTNTGFDGPTCEENIDDCQGTPCQNNGTCIDEVKGYSCLCYNGYDGDDCENDINECENNPCENGASCLQRSNQALYTDPVYYAYLPPPFSYGNASGYVCVCATGFEGYNCSENINECKLCINQANCTDLIGDLDCVCALGWQGMYCDINIDECHSSPCQNQGTCIDKVGRYTCACVPEYGGIDCQVELQGCANHVCQNGATCVPQYDEQTFHSFICSCPDGFMGDTCETVTSFSLEDSGYLLDSSTAGESTLNYSLSFATTLENGLLLYSSVGKDFFTVELVLGYPVLRLFIDRESGPFVVELAMDVAVNDGDYHTMAVKFTSERVRLQVTMTSTASQTRKRRDVGALSCSGGVCDMSADLDPEESFIFGTMYIGSLSTDFVADWPRTKSGIHFTGCIQDVINEVTGRTLSGKDFARSNARANCSRVAVCDRFPCNYGSCIDLWTSYTCECDPGYTGPNCNYSFTQATFSLENSTSYSVFNTTQLSSTNNLIELGFRTRESMGLLFFTQAADASYIVITHTDQLVTATLEFDGTPVSVSVSSQFDNGVYHFVTLLRKNGTATLTVDALSDTGAMNDSLDPTFLESYVGGYSNFSDTDLPMVVVSSKPFKGCMWDVKYNDISLQFFEIDIPDFVIGTLNGTLYDVVEGCQSDDTCRTQPCVNDGKCSVTWNDFECNCANFFTGKNCSEETICASKPCPGQARCMDRDDSYECITPATFSEANLITFKNNINFSRSLNSISFRMRSRKEFGIILRAMKGDYFLVVQLSSSSLRIGFNLGAPGELVATNYTVNDGRWHGVDIVVDTNTVNLRLDDTYMKSVETTLNFGLEELVSSGSNDVSVAGVNVISSEERTNLAGFIGCLENVRIGGILLPFLNSSIYNPDLSEKFYAKDVDIPLGCVGSPQCKTNQCQNNGTCVDVWNLFECDCLNGFAGDYCQTDVDECLQSSCANGLCIDAINNYTCSCDNGFSGINCEINTDECRSDPCQNGGTCLDKVGGFQCNCITNFTGRMCEFNVNQTCESAPCMYGSTCQELQNPEIGQDPFTCLCAQGYIGDRCAYEIDYCDNITCENGGTCVSNRTLQRYDCQCVFGFTGPFCEVNIDDCDGNLCSSGSTCRDLVGKYECGCSAGYTGIYCSVDIQECLSNPCYAGTCVDIVNGYKCQCPDGYEGIHCDQDIDECQRNNPCVNNGACSNEPGNYTCSCPLNFLGRHCEINPCKLNPCRNYGVCNTLNETSFSCNCAFGYIGALCQSTDCSRVTCQNGGTCREVESRSSWMCNCPQKYSSGYNCEFKGYCALDVCENNSTCNQTLVDTTFEFDCQCLIGYNGTFCMNEIDWCASNPCQQQDSNCSSTNEAFTCTCAPGFDGDFCEAKLPDCLSDLCLNGATCTDLMYSYECACVPGFTGFNCEMNINDCTGTSCQNGGQCVDGIDGFTCNCDGTGYNGTQCESDIDECSVGLVVCGNGGTCQNLAGSVKCECTDGFIGDFCNTPDYCFGDPCKNSGVCELTETSYRCSCFGNYEGANCETFVGNEPSKLGLIFVIIGGILLLIILIIVIILTIRIRKQRATEGTYSPRRQEISGSRVEMDNIIKVPPPERLI